MNKSAIFKKAHALAKSWITPKNDPIFGNAFYKSYADLFAQALRKVYRDIKMALEQAAFQSQMDHSGNAYATAQVCNAWVKRMER